MHLDIGVTDIFDDVDLFYKLLNLKLIVDLALVQVNQQTFEPFSGDNVFVLEVIFHLVLIWVEDLNLLDWDQEILLLKSWDQLLYLLLKIYFELDVWCKVVVFRVGVRPDRVRFLQVERGQFLVQVHQGVIHIILVFVNRFGGPTKVLVA